MGSFHDCLHGLVADLPRRDICNPLECDVVIKGNKAQVAERVLDLSSFEEPHSTPDDVADLVAHERLLNGAGQV